VPFIILTASLDERLRAGAERLADTVLLRKPLTPQELVDCAVSRLRSEPGAAGEAEAVEIATDPSEVREGRTPTLVGPVVHRMLVPVDFSPGAHEALSYAVFLAGRLGAAIDIVHVCEPRDVEGSANERLAAFARSAEGRILDDYVAAVERGGITRVRARIEEGRVAEVIIGLVSNEGYDLVVMAKREADPGTPELGGLTDSIVRGAECPVVTLHHSIRVALGVPRASHAAAAPARETLQ
jgi:universal stress protein A